MTYRFRVGVKPLSSVLGALDNIGYNHACLLLNRDLFEYGANEEKSYQRHRDVGRDSSFNWDKIGEALNGTTYISPDQLETAIKNNGTWATGHYNVLTHNCHDFVQFCLDRIGCPQSMIIKKGQCYKRQNNNNINNNEAIYKNMPFLLAAISKDIVIRSALTRKNLDIRGNDIKNGTDIILYQAHGGGSQTFHKVENEDGSLTFKKDGYAIDVRYSEVSNGTTIHIWECNGTNAQKFYLKNEGDGFVSIHSALNYNYVIDVQYSQTDDFTKIQLWEYNGSNAQKFKLIPQMLNAF